MLLFTIKEIVTVNTNSSQQFLHEQNLTLQLLPKESKYSSAVQDTHVFRVPRERRKIFLHLAGLRPGESHQGVLALDCKNISDRSGFVSGKQKIVKFHHLVNPTSSSRLKALTKIHNFLSTKLYMESIFILISVYSCESNRVEAM